MRDGYSPIVVQQLAVLSASGSDYGQQPSGAELVLMTHTNCGIANFTGPDRGDALAAILGVTADEIDSRAVTDPREAVRGDIALLADNPLIPDELAVTGVVYDVETGLIDLVERRAPLRCA